MRSDSHNFCLLLDIPGSVTNTGARQRRELMMDWMFYLYVAVVLFSVLAVILTIRHFLDRRLERLEQKRRMEEETRQVADSNSGL